jgi:glycosyltransferase involved in cell wall biosynthesis
VVQSLRIAILVNPFTLGMKWGEHAPELARELLGRGHTVRDFGAPVGAIPRSGVGLDAAHDDSTSLTGFKPDAIIAYDALSPAAYLGARTARKLGIPLLIVEGASPSSLHGRGKIFQAIGGVLWGHFVRNQASTVIALDPVARQHLLKAGFAPGRVNVVSGGVDLEDYRPGLASGLILRHHIRGRILLYCGQVTRKRGLNTLVTAFAQTVGQREDWSLVFAGDGPEVSELRARIVQLGIGSRVHWIGKPRVEELAGLMSAATLLAVPAEDDNVRGKNIPRAMACGLPVIASDRPCLSTLVQDDVTGLIVRSGELAAWVEALRRASMSPDARKRWSIAARAQAVERYGWARIARVHEEALLQARQQENAEALAPAPSTPRA